MVVIVPKVTMTIFLTHISKSNNAELIFLVNIEGVMYSSR